MPTIFLNIKVFPKIDQILLVTSSIFHRLSSMESLLRWSIENSGPSAGPPQPRTDLDPGVIDAILGKSDVELMKEDLAVAIDPHRSEDARVEALDHLEMVRLFTLQFVLS